MAKALRVLVLILLVLSIASLWLGIVLFRQREVVKGRTQKLERGLAEIAQKLAAPKEPHIVAIDRRVDPEILKDYAQMDGQITLVGRIAETRLEQYFQEGEDHRATKGELTRTKLELDNTIRQLNDTREQLAQARREIAEKEAEIARQRGRIGELERELAELNKTVGELRRQVADLEEKVHSKEIEIARLEDLINRDRGGAAEAVRAVKPGLSGEIITVNPDWNFVILNIGSRDTLVPSAEMLVHRGDNLIGRVRVRSVTENLAIAEIIRDWELQPLREGDRVLF